MGTTNLDRTEISHCHSWPRYTLGTHGSAAEGGKNDLADHPDGSSSREKTKTNPTGPRSPLSRSSAVVARLAAAGRRGRSCNLSSAGCSWSNDSGDRLEPGDSGSYAFCNVLSNDHLEQVSSHGREKIPTAGNRCPVIS